MIGWEYTVGRFGIKFARVLFGTLLAVCLFAGWQLYHSARHWWDGRQLDKVTEQRDTAIAQRDVARVDAKQADLSAIAAQAARVANDARVPAVRTATAKAVERATREIETAPVAPVVRPAEQLHDDAEAVARYRAAAGRVRGTRAAR